MFRRNLRNSFFVFAIVMGLSSQSTLDVKAAPMEEVVANEEVIRVRCAEQEVENKSKSEQLRDELESVESAKMVTELELKEKQIGKQLTESIISSIDEQLSGIRTKYINLANKKMGLVEVSGGVYRYGYSLADTSNTVIVNELESEMAKLSKIQQELRVEKTKRLRDLDNIVLSEIDLEVRLDNIFCDAESIKSEMEQVEEEALYNMNTAVAVDMYAEVDFSKVINAAELTRDVNGTTGLDLVNWASQFVGNPYVYGGTDILHGIDCSAFIQQIYGHFGYSLPRTSDRQRNAGEFVTSIADAQPGDIFCYPGHVAMYCGNGVLIHASNHNDGIKYSNVNYKQPLCVKRIITHNGQSAGSISNQAFDLVDTTKHGDYFSIDIVKKEADLVGQAEEIKLSNRSLYGTDKNIEQSVRTDNKEKEN